MKFILIRLRRPRWLKLYLKNNKENYIIGFRRSLVLSRDRCLSLVTKKCIFPLIY